jgi:hypothetical protein
VGLLNSDYLNLKWFSLFLSIKNKDLANENKMCTFKTWFDC